MSTPQYWADNGRESSGRYTGARDSANPAVSYYDQANPQTHKVPQGEKENIHTYGTQNKVMLQYSTKEIEELEKHTQAMRNELRNSHSKLNRAREDFLKERSFNEELKHKSRSASPVNTPSKYDRSFNDLQNEHHQLSNHKDRLEKDYNANRKQVISEDLRDEVMNSVLKGKERELSQSQQQKELLVSRLSEEDHIRRLVNIYTEENDRLYTIIKGNNGRVSDHDLEYMRQNSNTLKKQIEEILNEKRKSNGLVEEILINHENLKRENNDLNMKYSRASEDAQKWKKAASLASSQAPIESPRFANAAIEQEAAKEKLAAQQAEQAYRKAADDLQKLINQMNENQQTLSEIKIDDKHNLPLNLRNVQNRKSSMGGITNENENKIRRLDAEIKSLNESLIDPRYSSSQRMTNSITLHARKAERDSIFANQQVAVSEIQRLSTAEEGIKNSMIAPTPVQGVDAEQLRARDAEISSLKWEKDRINQDLSRAREDLATLQRQKLAAPSHSVSPIEVQLLKEEIVRKEDQIRKLVNENNGLTLEKKQILAENQKVNGELKLTKMDLDGNKDELQRTQAKMRNMARVSDSQLQDTTAKKPSSPRNEKTFIGQVSKEELEVLDNRLVEFDECNKQLNNVINNLQKTIGANRSAQNSMLGGPLMQESYYNDQSLEATHILKGIVGDLDRKISRLEEAGNKNQVHFVNMLQDLSTRPVQGAKGSNHQTYIDPSAIRLIMNVKNAQDNQEMDTLRDAKKELEIKTNRMTAEKIQLETQIENLIGELRKSKNFFEQMTSDLNEMRDKEVRLRCELAEAIKKYNFEADSRRSSDAQLMLARQELQKLLRDQEINRREFQSLKSQIEQYSARKRAQESTYAQRV